MSEIENGDKSTWVIGRKTLDEYYNQYWANYIDSIKTENIGSQKIIYFKDGSAVTLDKWGGGASNGNHFFFCPKAINCKQIDEKNFGKTIFVFAFWNDPDPGFDRFHFHNGEGVIPYVANLAENYTINDLYNGHLGCNTVRSYYCTKIIQLNGWKIPENYPFRF